MDRLAGSLFGPPVVSPPDRRSRSHPAIPGGTRRQGILDIDLGAFPYELPGVDYHLAGKVRNHPVEARAIIAARDAVKAVDPDLDIVVTSAAQDHIGTPGAVTAPDPNRANASRHDRVGSTRHDVPVRADAPTRTPSPTSPAGHAVDFIVTRRGDKVTYAEEPAVITQVAENLAAVGFSGIGFPSKSNAAFHADFSVTPQDGYKADGTPNFKDNIWGYDNVPQSARDAIKEGRTKSFGDLLTDIDPSDTNVVYGGKPAIGARAITRENPAPRSKPSPTELAASRSIFSAPASPGPAVATAPLETFEQARPSATEVVQGPTAPTITGGILAPPDPVASTITTGVLAPPDPISATPVTGGILAEPVSPTVRATPVDPRAAPVATGMVMEPIEATPIETTTVVSPVSTGVLDLPQQTPDLVAPSPAPEAPAAAQSPVTTSGRVSAGIEPPGGLLAPPEPLGGLFAAPEPAAPSAPAVTTSGRVTAGIEPPTGILGPELGLPTVSTPTTTVTPAEMPTTGILGSVASVTQRGLTPPEPVTVQPASQTASTVAPASTTVRSRETAPAAPRATAPSPTPQQARAMQRAHQAPPAPPTVSGVLGQPTVAGLAPSVRADIQARGIQAPEGMQLGYSPMGGVAAVSPNAPESVQIAATGPGLFGAIDRDFPGNVGSAMEDRMAKQAISMPGGMAGGVSWWCGWHGRCRTSWGPRRRASRIVYGPESGAGAAGSVRSRRHITSRSVGRTLRRGRRRHQSRINGCDRRRGSARRWRALVRGETMNTDQWSITPANDDLAADDINRAEGREPNTINNSVVLEDSSNDRPS